MKTNKELVEIGNNTFRLFEEQDLTNNDVLSLLSNMLVLLLLQQIEEGDAKKETCLSIIDDIYSIIEGATNARHNHVL